MLNCFVNFTGFNSVPIDISLQTKTLYGALQPLGQLRGHIAL